MQKRNVVSFLFLFICFAAKAQHPDFTPNIVKIKGSMLGGYGFITSVDRGEKSAHFIRITKETRQAEQVSVLTQGGKSVISASLVRPVLTKNGYNILVYRLNSYVPAELKYFHSSSAKTNKYYGFADRRRNAPDSLTPKLSRHDLTVEALGNKNLLTQIISFETGDKGAFGLGSTPIVDPEGMLVALAAEDQEEDKSLFEALDISAIQQLLEDMGAKAGNPCRYFNLIPQGAYHDENTCQKVIRLQQEEVRRIEDAKQQRAKELQQENLKKIFELYESGNRERVVVKQYNKNRDRGFGMSIGGSGFFSLLDFRPSADVENSGTVGPTFGYSVGPNLYFGIDRTAIRLVLKPRYSLIQLGFSENFVYGAGIDFKPSSMSYTAIELPVSVDLIFKKHEDGDDFFNIGYAVSKHISNELTYTTDNVKTKEAIVGYRKMSQYVQGEFGASRGRFRGSVFAKYQLTPYARSNYEIIVDTKPVSPFKDVSDHYWAFGLELQMRLWNRWNNDYRTMKITN